MLIPNSNHPQMKCLDHYMDISIYCLKLIRSKISSDSSLNAAHIHQGLKLTNYSRYNSYIATYITEIVLEYPYWLHIHM